MPEVLVVEVRSDDRPRRGQKARSSENFSLAAVPAGAEVLIWRTEPGTPTIRFSVMADIRASLDQRVLSNIVSGGRTRIPLERESLTLRGFYIAEPSGSPDGAFVVRVFALVPD